MHVPSQWPLELLNAVRAADTRGRLTAPDSWEFLEWVFTLPIVVDEPLRGSSYVALLHLARELSVSVYDATYLELARRLGVPLATRDAALIAAAARTGVSIFGVERGVSSA